MVRMTSHRCAPCERDREAQRVEERRAYGRAGKDTSARGQARRRVYDSPEWKAMRQRVMLRDGACRLCGTTRNLTVHHVRPAADDGAGALDMENLVTLCRRCHGRVDGPKAARHKRARAAGTPRPRTIGRRGS